MSIVQVCTLLNRCKEPARLPMRTIQLPGVEESDDREEEQAVGGRCNGTSLQFRERITFTGCAKKVTPFWYLTFLPLLDVLFAIFVYLHIIFIKCLISEPSVVNIRMDSPAHCAIAHCEKHDKLPQKGKCFIHRASCVASKQL